MTPVLVAVGAVAVAALVVYGARRMIRGDREKVVVLSRLVGQNVILWIALRDIMARHCVILRVEHGNVVIRDRDNAERVYPIASVHEVQQGHQRWGPW